MSYVPLPAKLRASAFSQMNNVVLEPSGDLGDAAGQDVGYIKDGSWMDYLVTVPVGAGGRWIMTLRLASPIDSGKLTVLSGGNALITTGVPNTGAWQKYIDVPLTVYLLEGQQTIRLLSVAGNWNITTINFAQVPVNPNRKLLFTVLVYDDNSTSVIKP